MKLLKSLIGLFQAAGLALGQYPLQQLVLVIVNDAEAKWGEIVLDRIGQVEDRVASGDVGAEQIRLP